MAHFHPIDIAIARQCEHEASGHIMVAKARRRIQLLQRMQWHVPLHEWAEATKRGGQAVYLLLESYQPGNARYLLADGFTPRCPPWATRKYRTAAKIGPVRPFAAQSASTPAGDTQ